MTIPKECQALRIFVEGPATPCYNPAPSVEFFFARPENRPMKEQAIALLRCPGCQQTLHLEQPAREGNDLRAGKFTCSGCRSTYAVQDGLGVFLPNSLTREVAQVRLSYSDKWDRLPDMYDEDSWCTRHQREWYLQRYHWSSEDALREFVGKHRLILDAGCGLGRDIRRYAQLNPNATVVGADLSQAAVHACEKARPYPNISVICADLNRLPFARETFDLVTCDQVLPCVEDPRLSVERLWSLVKPGGHFAWYVYKVKAPLREHSDDLLRARIARMAPKDGWEECIAITKLGKALADLKIEFQIPEDIPALGIKAGTMDLQRFIYYNILKCFWNDQMTFDENNLVNFDWFHPAYTYRHSVEDVQRWCTQLGMKVLVLDTADLSGISVLAEKPAHP